MHPNFRIKQRIATNFRLVKAKNIEDILPQFSGETTSQRLYKKLSLVRLTSTTQFIVLYLTLQIVLVRKLNKISC